MGTPRKSGLSRGAERFLKGAFITPSSKLIRHAAADRPPKMALRAMVREVEQAANTTGTDDLGAFVAELLSLIRSEAAAGPLKPIEVPAPTNDIETVVCAHFDNLEQRLPFATMLLIGGLGFARPHRTEVTYTTVRLAASLSRSRGEHKLELLRPFAWHVLENEYGPFLQVLLQADCATKGEAFPVRDTVGALVRDARKRGILGPHLWFEAGKVRNAAAHRRSWDYDVARKTVYLADDKQTPPWRPKYKAAALSERLHQLVAEGHSLTFALSRAFMRDLVAPLGAAFITLATIGEKGPMEAAYKPIEERLQRTAAELRNLGWEQSP
jgi:hypothetical protein